MGMFGFCDVTFWFVMSVFQDAMYLCAALYVLKWSVIALWDLYSMDTTKMPDLSDSKVSVLARAQQTTQLSDYNMKSGQPVATQRIQSS